MQQPYAKSAFRLVLFQLLQDFPAGVPALPPVFDENGPVDGVHPTVEGYRLMAEAVMAVFNE